VGASLSETCCGMDILLLASRTDMSLSSAARVGTQRQDWCRISMLAKRSVQNSLDHHTR